MPRNFCCDAEFSTAFWLIQVRFRELRILNSADRLLGLVIFFDDPAAFVPTHYVPRIRKRRDRMIGQQEPFQRLNPLGRVRFPDADDPQRQRLIPVLTIFCGRSTQPDRRDPHFQSSLHQNSLTPDQPADHAPVCSLSGSIRPRISPPALQNRAPIRDEYPTSCCKNFPAECLHRESIVAITTIQTPQATCCTSRGKKCAQTKVSHPPLAGTRQSRTRLCADQ